LSAGLFASRLIAYTPAITLDNRALPTMTALSIATANAP